MAYMPPKTEVAELPEEDMDARGGGQVHDEMRRCVVCVCV